MIAYLGEGQQRTNWHGSVGLAAAAFEHSEIAR
jgi:hypothetical protein